VTQKYIWVKTPITWLMTFITEYQIFTGFEGSHENAKLDYADAVFLVLWLEKKKCPWYLILLLFFFSRF